MGRRSMGNQSGMHQRGTKKAIALELCIFFGLAFTIPAIPSCSGNWWLSRWAFVSQPPIDLVLGSGVSPQGLGKLSHDRRVLRIVCCVRLQSRSWLVVTSSTR